MEDDGMNLSLNDQFSLFASFPSYLKASSWPTYSSMSCEAVFKSEKKYIKNQKLII
jgi:hypothetical protein